MAHVALLQLVSAEVIVDHLHPLVLGSPPFQGARGCVDSIVARVTQDVFGTELCPSMAHKAAAYLRLARSHCFPDGNKRVAILAMQTFLRLNGLVLAENGILWSNPRLEDFVVEYVTSFNDIQDADAHALDVLTVSLAEAQ